MDPEDLMIQIQAALTPYNRPAPAGSRWVQIKHWCQTGLHKDYKDFRGFTYGDQTGLPNVWKAIGEAKDIKVPIVEAVQRHIFDILKRSTVGLTEPEQLAIWRNVMKGNIAFANGTGWDNGNADFIQGTNLTHEPIRLEQILIGGGTHLVTEEGPTVSKIFAWDLKNRMNEFLQSTPWNNIEGWQPAVISRTQHLDNPDPSILFPQRDALGFRYEEITPFPRTDRIGSNYIYMPTVTWNKDYLLIANTSLRFMTDSEVKPAIPLLNWSGMKNRSILKERVG
jgi:hypothetical protein